MKVPFSWLKEYVDIDITPQELETRLFSCGFEVEELIDLSAGISRVVVGELTHIEKQEGTDHLNLCRVNCGEKYGTDIAITTGAQNIFEGARVPVALDGATLPGGFQIKKRMMQGVESNGMMCSGTELGINDDWYPGAEVHGLLILDKDTPLGEDICKVVGLDDYIFDISITANRPDCQSDDLLCAGLDFAPVRQLGGRRSGLADGSKYEPGLLFPVALGRNGGFGRSRRGSGSARGLLSGQSAVRKAPL